MTMKLSAPDPRDGFSWPVAPGHAPYGVALARVGNGIFRGEDD